MVGEMRTQDAAIEPYAPRRPTPAPTHACAGLYPAKRNISPAHYSLSNEVEKRIATSARTDAWLARLIIK